MRNWFMAAIAALAIGTALPTGVEAVPAGDQPTFGGAAVSSSPVQEARYVVRCHNVRVRRHTHHGPRWVVVRRCSRHYYR